MILAKIANSHNDEYYTPKYAIIPLLKYLRPHSKVWCPFDTAESNFVKIFEEAEHKVHASHILSGQDFFAIAPPECDYVISNPPYSLKGEVLQRLFEIGKPFAMLVGVVGLFESKRRFDMFRQNDFEVMYFDKRISYFKDYGDMIPSINPPFSSVYVCHEMLPQQIVFEQLNKSIR